MSAVTAWDYNNWLLGKKKLQVGHQQCVVIPVNAVGKNYIQDTAVKWSPGCVNAAGKARQKAEVVSNSNNPIHQTWGPPFNRALFCVKFNIDLPHLLSEGP